MYSISWVYYLAICGFFMLSCFMWFVLRTLRQRELSQFPKFPLSQPRMHGIFTFLSEDPYVLSFRSYRLTSFRYCLR